MEDVRDDDDLAHFESSFLRQLSSIKTAYKSSKTPLKATILDRMWQSLEDVQVMAKIKRAQSIESLQLKVARLQNSSAISTDRSTGPSSDQKQRIVVIGSGWGAHAFLKTVDSLMYDVVVISPRQFFTFTPMLAASAVGTVDFRSIVEPIRNVNPLVEFIEASAESIDFENRSIFCVSLKCEGNACSPMRFAVGFDVLVLAVGAAVNTFQVPGVREHCIFMKHVEDAARFRSAVASCFERANLPGLSDEERRATLSFVVVGAGPTGVELTGELRDWVAREGRAFFPHLLPYVSLTLVEAGNAILPVFDSVLQEEALRTLTRHIGGDALAPPESTRPTGAGWSRQQEPVVRTTVRLRASVQRVNASHVHLGDGTDLPYGICVWAGGNGPLPLTTRVIAQLNHSQQAHQAIARGRLVTDAWLRVSGAPRGGVFALGDCATPIEETEAPPSPTGGPHFSRSVLPATAQVASQQGAYLGRLFSKGYDMAASGSLPPWKPDLSDAKAAIEFAKPFQFLNLGVLAYLGASQALAQIHIADKSPSSAEARTTTLHSSGKLGFFLWRGVYWFKQVSWRNRLLVTFDWAKTRLFGRDLGTTH